MRKFPLMKKGKLYFFICLCFTFFLTIMGWISMVYFLIFYKNEARIEMILFSVLITIIGLFLCIYMFVVERKKAYTTIGISADGIYIFLTNKKCDTMYWSDVNDYGICSIYHLGYYMTEKYIYFSTQMLTDRDKLYMVTTANNGKICLPMSEELLFEIKKFFQQELSEQHYTRRGGRCGK